MAAELVAEAAETCIEGSAEAQMGSLEGGLDGVAGSPVQGADSCGVVFGAAAVGESAGESINLGRAPAMYFASTCTSLSWAWFWMRAGVR